MPLTMCFFEYSTLEAEEKERVVHSVGKTDRERRRALLTNLETARLNAPQQDAPMV